MKVAVLGAGAIGAYVGAALHRAGADVHLVARGPHLAAMRQHGVRVLSPRGDFTARAHATDDPAAIGPVDYVFLGLKANSYAACGPLIEPLLHDATAVIALLVYAGYLAYRAAFTINYDALTFSLAVYAAEVHGFFSLFLFFHQTWHLRARKVVEPEKDLTVDVFITTYNEDVELLRQTVRAALAMRGGAA